MLMGQRWSKGDEHFFAAIDVETLLIHGRHDRLISPAHTQLMHEVLCPFTHCGTAHCTAYVGLVTDGQWHSAICRI